MSRVLACLGMIGAGAIVGTLAGGHTNAARSLALTETSDVAADAVASGSTVPSESPAAVAAERLPVTAAAPPELSPAAIVAMRFPTRAQYMQTIDARPPAPMMAFAAEPKRKPAVPSPAAAEGGFQLASVDPAPAMPKRVVRPAQPKNPVLFNDAQLASIKARLRLTPDQERYWPQVEQALRAISWRIATQQDAKRPVRGNQASMIDPNGPEVQRLKSAAFPLIMSMRADQKQEVRQLAHTMGLSQVAAQF